MVDMLIIHVDYILLCKWPRLTYLRQSDTIINDFFCRLHEQEYRDDTHPNTHSLKNPTNHTKSLNQLS